MRNITVSYGSMSSELSMPNTITIYLNTGDKLDLSVEYFYDKNTHFDKIGQYKFNVSGRVKYDKARNYEYNFSSRPMITVIPGNSGYVPPYLDRANYTEFDITDGNIAEVFAYSLPAYTKLKIESSNSIGQINAVNCDIEVPTGAEINGGVLTVSNSVVNIYGNANFKSIKINKGGELYVRGDLVVEHSVTVNDGELSTGGNVRIGSDMKAYGASEIVMESGDIVVFGDFKIENTKRNTFRNGRLFIGGDFYQNCGGVFGIGAYKTNFTPASSFDVIIFGEGDHSVKFTSPGSSYMYNYYVDEKCNIVNETGLVYKGINGEAIIKNLYGNVDCELNENVKSKRGNAK